MEPISAVLVGAGGRGFQVVGPFAQRFPHLMKITAVAEPVDQRRETFAKMMGIPSSARFNDWQDLLDRPTMGEVLFNCTGDSLHVPVSRTALECGYHVMLEKPLSDTPQGCVELVQLARQSDRILQVGLCLRFTPFYQQVRASLEAEAVGRIITVDYQENIDPRHMAHSFVRGNWRNESHSSPMIISKSCHDLDMLVWLLGRRCVRVSSFGELTWFRSENAPPGAPPRCTDGCPHEHVCPYSAIKMYVLDVGPELGYGNAAWYVSASSDPKERWNALETSPYGRCVYQCDNDVVDHQVINIEYEDSITVAFTMQGFATPSADGGLWGPLSAGVGRRFTFWGSKGMLNVPTYGHVEITDHLTRHTERIQTGYPEGGHGGGDFNMIHDFLAAVGRGDAGSARSTAEQSLHGHMIGFAAEQSRHSGSTVDMKEYEAGFGL